MTILTSSPCQLPWCGGSVPRFAEDMHSIYQCAVSLDPLALPASVAIPCTAVPLEPGFALAGQRLTEHRVTDRMVDPYAVALEQEGLSSAARAILEEQQAASQEQRRLSMQLLEQMVKQ